MHTAVVEFIYASVSFYFISEYDHHMHLVNG